MRLTASPDWFRFSCSVRHSLNVKKHFVCFFYKSLKNMFICFIIFKYFNNVFVLFNVVFFYSC